MNRGLLGLCIGAVIGAIVGYSQVLCSNGQCVMTGTWFGGGIIGGLMGYLLLARAPHLDADAAERVPVRVRRDPPQRPPEA